MRSMKCLLPVAVALSGLGMATPVQAQSRFDVCAAYARDNMMAFYSSSAVPVPLAERAWERSYRHGGWGRRDPHPPTHGVGSLGFYFNQCRSRES